MRNLTIKRQKSFVASLMKVQVYIEDYTCQDTIIKDVPCRKLGTLKNNEEKTFAIGDNEAKVFVIGDKLSKGFCNDFYTIPAGVEDVYLTGKNRYNPLNGNAFLFDGVTDEEALKNRKKSKKIGLIVLIVAAIIGFVFGFLKGYSEDNAQPEAFVLDEMSITLTDQFEKVTTPDSDFALESNDVMVFVVKEEFSLLEDFGDLTLEEYGELVIENNGLSEVSELNKDDGLVSFDYIYEDETTGLDIYYLSYVYKSEEAFWVVQFSVYDNESYDYLDNIYEWAASVEFAE